MDNSCNNTHILNEVDVPIIAMGMNNVVISASPDGILVSDKTISGNIKKYVDELDRRVMYAEKSWGCFRVIDVEKDSLTIKVNIKPGDSMNYHSHQQRNEVWVIVGGEGIATIDGIDKKAYAGDVIEMKAGCKHTIEAVTELTIIETQIGKDISVHDKIKHILKKQQWKN